MNTIFNFHRLLGRLVWLLLALVCLPHAGGAAVVDVKFDLLETKTGVYSNVTVTTTAPDYIVVQHARGLASIKITELTTEVLKELGYIKGDAADNNSSTAAKATALVNAIPTKDLEQAWNKYAPAGIPQVKLSPGILLAGLGLFVVLYLFFCYCGSLICQKAGKPAGILIWLPVLQYIPLFRAADMSPAWLLAMFVPGLNIVAHIIWSFKIARARSQGLMTAILLILPTYPLAFMYLAFAAGTPPADEKAPAKKFTPTSLTFDTA